MQLAKNGHTDYVIITQAGATPAELHAAKELAQHLHTITGADFPIREAANAPSKAIVIGQGAVTRRCFPTVDLSAFGQEQLVIRTEGKRLLLAGGRPRGTLYAVMRFLATQCGVRWWTAWASQLPHTPNLTLPTLNRVEQPAFESRDPYWFVSGNTDWAVHNLITGQRPYLDETHGGGIRYKGFVHTFFPLVPPEKYFSKHPEWYSLIKGKRVYEGAQLCTTNPELRDFLVEQVKASLKESPEASILSVSQNDWFNPCECERCKALDDEEGSHAGTMLALVNYIAEKVKPDFPHVAIDTLAYQYTRKAPKSLKPLPNVIVRLCSIECNFGASLEDPSNKSFADDIRAWSQKSNRLYIWDYTTNFSHYVLPHPNWFVLGENVRFFHKYGVRGLFEQGAYQSDGGEMAELRTWLLAQLLWNPYQDDRALIKEFLQGYYGNADKAIYAYLELLSQAAKGFYLTCNTSPTAPFLKYTVLSKAERLWQEAEHAVQNDPERLWRVRQGHLPIQYTALQNWQALRRNCLEDKAEWVFPTSRKALADQWLAVATGKGPVGWSPMTLINEGGTTPQAFVEQFQNDPTSP